MPTRLPMPIKHLLLVVCASTATMTYCVGMQLCHVFAEDAWFWWNSFLVYKLGSGASWPPTLTINTSNEFTSRFGLVHMCSERVAAAACSYIAFEFACPSSCDSHTSACMWIRPFTLLSAVTQATWSAWRTSTAATPTIQGRSWSPQPLGERTPLAPCR